MGACVIDGRRLAAELKEKLAAEVAGKRDAGPVPGFATVLIGSPAEAAVYKRREASARSPTCGSSGTPPMAPGSPLAPRQPGAHWSRRTQVLSWELVQWELVQYLWNLWGERLIR